MNKQAKVTLNELPEKPLASAIEQMTAKAVEQVDVQDANGRTITLKRPGFLAEFQLAEVLGDVPDRYMNMVLPVMYVAAIDGDRVLPPASKREVEIILKRLDAAGYRAVLTGIKEHLADADQATRESVKN